MQYAAQKESEEAGQANGTSSNTQDGEAAEANGTAETDADGKPVSSDMAAMLAVDSKRALTAAIRAQVGVHKGPAGAVQW